MSKAGVCRIDLFSLPHGLARRLFFVNNFLHIDNHVGARANKNARICVELITMQHKGYINIWYAAQVSVERFEYK